MRRTRAASSSCRSTRPARSAVSSARTGRRCRATATSLAPARRWRPRRSASPSASSSSASSTQRRASSSESRSGSTRPSRTSWPTRTQTSSSRGRSCTGRRGVSRKTTSRRRSPRPRRSRSRQRQPCPRASARSRFTAGPASPGSIRSIASTSARSGLRASARGLPSSASKSQTRCSASPFPSDRGGSVDGQMMDFQLTLPHLLKRAELYFGAGEIVSRQPDKTFHRTTYRDSMRRARQLAVALGKLGIERGDRVATLCWNHHQHHEAYFGIPCGGFVLHTLNLRLHPNDLAYIANHAGDKVVIVDQSLLPVLDQFKDRTQIEHVLVVEESYEELLRGVSENDFREL